MYTVKVFEVSFKHPYASQVQDPTGSVHGEKKQGFVCLPFSDVKALHLGLRDLTAVKC